MTNSASNRTVNRRIGVSWFVTAFILVVLLCSICSLLAAFVDLLIVRHGVEKTIVGIQDQLREIGPWLFEDGTLSPQSQAFVDVLEAKSLDLLNANLMEVLFGVISVIFISMGLFLLQQASQTVDRTEETAADVRTQAASIREDLDQMERRSDTIDRRMMQIEDRIDGVAQTLVPLAKSLSSSSELVTLASAAYVYGSLLANDRDNPTSPFGAPLLDSLTFLEAELQPHKRIPGIGRKAWEMIYDFISRIRDVVDKMPPSSGIELKETCERILVLLEQGHFVEDYDQILAKISTASTSA